MLSLLGLVPGVLLPTAALVFGFTLLFGMGVQNRLAGLELECSSEQEMARGEMARRTIREVVSAALGMRVLFGLGAMALGIISLVGILPVTLTLVTMLSVGGTTLLSGAAVSARAWGFAGFCEVPPEPIGM